MPNQVSLIQAHMAITRSTQAKFTVPRRENTQRLNIAKRHDMSVLREQLHRRTRSTVHYLGVRGSHVELRLRFTNLLTQLTHVRDSCTWRSWWRNPALAANRNHCGVCFSKRRNSDVLGARHDLCQCLNHLLAQLE
ncbi:uncharacterized protein LOC142565964 [Dermacentor variabilis]|uniref:uncharacterized protein LOC142565964 n=1 Tax=Dermacentor variabilis TaxID=34621 RepID=UPI003F5B9C5C